MGRDTGEQQLREQVGSTKRGRRRWERREPSGGMACCEHGVWEKQPPAFFFVFLCGSADPLMKIHF
jgi:hypothetical protein